MQNATIGYILIFTFIAVLTSNCSSKKTMVQVSELSPYISKKLQSNKNESCATTELYSSCIIKDYTAIKFVRVNFHFMNSTDKTNNYSVSESQDLVKKLLRNANLRLRTNHKMNLPVGNDTPVCPPYYQYVLHADDAQQSIYHHYDDKLCFFANKGKHRNNYNIQVIDKYAVNLDSVINVFVMPHIPKSMQDNKYKESRTGVALGNGLKIAGLFEAKKKPWEVATLLNHEIGHILGLRHSWSPNDGCDDTPRHPNCWSSSGDGKCATASNNVMDYNNSQMAWTPCQIGRIHKSFNNTESTQRKLLIPHWCDKNQTPLTINQNVTWSQALDVNQDIIITSGHTLEIQCRVHMAEDTSITIEPNATLILNDSRLHNDCGTTWDGIRILTSRKSTGKLIASADAVIEDIQSYNTFIQEKN